MSESLPHSGPLTANAASLFKAEALIVEGLRILSAQNLTIRLAASLPIHSPRLMQLAGVYRL